MIDTVDKYSYRLIWSEEDQAYVGLCNEFPSLSWLEDCPDSALAGVIRLVQQCIKDMS